VVDPEKLRQFLGALRPEFTNVDWTALARKVLVENPQQAWNELPGKLQASRDLLNQYEPGKGIDPRLMDQFMNLTGSFAPMGLTAYHGSPYLFRQFDLAKRGTGEGAQAYGTGAGYTAEARALGERYRKDVSDLMFETGNKQVFDPSTLEHINVRAMVSRGDLEGAIKKAEQIVASQTPVADKAARDLNVLRGIQQSGGIRPAQGYLYKGDIPDEIIPKFLDWDKPLKDQSKEVQNLAKQYKIDLNDLGGDLVARVGKGIEGTAIMENAGIKGIRYLDQSSRAEGKGTSNFIPFSPDDYKIQEINDIPIDEWIRKGLLGP
jgi:hypothetical protein